MRIARPTRVIAALLLGASSAGLAAGQTPDTLALPDGRVVEVIGLRRWTLAMLQDSLARYAPGESLQSHACAAVLRYTLGFADAAATTYTWGPDRPARVVVSVREPQDSARVHYRALPLDTAPGRPAWRALTAGAARRPAAFWPTLQAYLAGPGSPALRYRSSADSIDGAAMLAFLRSRTAERDRRAAQDALARSPSTFDRVAAVLILANFPGRDDTYWALAEAMRESDGMVKAVAAEVLSGLADRTPRPVDWMPASATVHAMLDGTSLFVAPQFIRVLPHTGIGPAQARAFLHGGGDMLLAYLASGTPMLAEPSHTLLVRLRGADLGRATAPWRAWIATL